ncbi:hypothetical protein EUGRSUZ_G01762 [Eucalyptus grandis]|uniref:Uncharacterized protein n=2 Tax=Eucalyptus grandis TaxID=71139 RepID=A0ACC3K404_EUCGR|nr:hypothetical protein EUGRSUZ_G01762 [Eucalyptus grandis]
MVCSMTEAELVNHLSSLSLVFTSQAISIQEASISDLQLAFKQNKLTSRQLTKFYLCKIRRLNPVVRAIIEVNPDGLKCANRADRESKAKKHDLLSILRGIPILLKDNIGTKDKQNTMASSFALLGSAVARDAGVVARLRRAGAVILGKANMNEWAGFRSLRLSSGSAISVVANMVAVSLGTETNGSILCPASCIQQPICRTVSDIVYVHDAIVGYDHNDAEATREASKYIPHGGYKKFLKAHGLYGKRLGIVRNPFHNFTNNPSHSFYEAFCNIKCKLYAIISPGFDSTPVLAIGGFLGISVPAGYNTEGMPFGICF